ncbi:MAG: hypothetical protein EOM67_02685 [Spirochaetia bacterium]|nr:hypothetical protein [Spirochaetia bacterium]
MAKQETGKKETTSFQDVNPKKRRRRNKQQQLKKSAKEHVVEKNQRSAVEKKKIPSSVPTNIKVPRVIEPLPMCNICGKPIQGIAQAISGPTKEEINHFDCVLRKITEDEKVMPPRKVSYIGKGTFAIIDTDENGALVFTKRIIFESPEHFDAYKKFVEEQKR